MGPIKRILVVDDEEPNRDLLEALLESLGYEPVTVGDGFQALERLTPDIDLVLLDVMMPGLDGFEVATRIRQDPRCGDVPIVMVTSLSGKEDRLRAVASGANDFVGKPIDRNELYVRMASLLKIKEAQDVIKRHRDELHFAVRNRTAELAESQERYRRLYEESKSREEFYHSFLNASADAIVVYDPEGRVQYLNPSFTRDFGWTLEELVGKRIPYVPESQEKATASLIRRVLAGTVTLSSLESQRYARNGEILDVSVSAARYDDHHGDAAGIVVIIRNITAFKSIERARRRAAHHLSHELITPLSVIKSSVKTLGQGDLSEESRMRTIERVRRNLTRLSDIQLILQDIVFPKPYQPRSFPVSAITTEIIRKVGAESAHRDLCLEERVHEMETDIIDPAVFMVVLETLLKNAIENTPDEGSTMVSLSPSPEGVLLIVQDHGMGVGARDREFIFKAFHHTQPTRSYATKRPFDFNAGGKGLELMRLKILSESGFFELSFQSERCKYIANGSGACPGRVSLCRHVANAEECRKSGGTTFTVLFVDGMHRGQERMWEGGLV